MWDSRIFWYVVSVTEFLNLNEGTITDVQITYNNKNNEYVVFFKTYSKDVIIFEVEEERYRDDD
jgi:hypothetical protein